jgi:hypothetical protein
VGGGERASSPGALADAPEAKQEEAPPGDGHEPPIMASCHVVVIILRKMTASCTQCAGCALCDDHPTGQRRHVVSPELEIARHVFGSPTIRSRRPTC